MVIFIATQRTQIYRPRTPFCTIFSGGGFQLEKRIKKNGDRRGIAKRSTAQEQPGAWRDRIAGRLDLLCEKKESLPETRGMNNYGNTVTRGDLFSSPAVLSFPG